MVKCLDVTLYLVDRLFVSSSVFVCTMTIATPRRGRCKLVTITAAFYAFLVIIGASVGDVVVNAFAIAAASSVALASGAF